MDNDKYFNLQLTIQKLEEELSLYRNGTTGSELLDLINEKDSELNTAKTHLSKTTQELSTLKSNFSTLIKSSRKTLADNESLRVEFSRTQEELTQLASQYSEQSTVLTSTTENLLAAESTLRDVSEKLATSIQFNEEKTEAFSRVSDQSMAYLKKVNSQSSQLKDYEKEIKILEHKLMAVNVDTSEDKEKITQLQLELRDQTMSSFKEKEKYNEAVTKARNTLIDKVNEVKSLTTTVTGLKEELLAKGSSFKLAVVSKDDEITELKRQVATLEKSHAEYVKTSLQSLESREEHWKSEAERLQKLNETDAKRIEKFEAERSNLSHFKRDMDTIKARNAELENKIKRQESYMKSRLLRDRSNNTLSAPEGSSKPGAGGRLSHTLAAHNNML